MSSTTAAPINVPLMQAGGGATATRLESRVLSSVSATILSYLKAIVDGQRGLTLDQLEEIENYKEAGVGESSAVDNRKLDLKQFLEYMTSSKANAMAPPEKIDLNFPISSYFISSSHNTYLSGNQLYGDANTEAYTNVLLRGCRCVEIDVWDGEKKDKDEDEEDKHGFRSRISEKWAKYRNKPDHATTAKEDDVKSEMPSPWRTISSTSRAEPRVLHGYTLTKEVSFRDVCAAIRDAAFVTSDLPVIVSLEIHTGPEQQEIMVDIMEEMWGSMLAAAPAEECKVLPTPAELKGKILVKVKGAAVEGAKPEALPDPQKIRSDSSSSAEDEKEDEEKKSKKKKKKKTKVVDSLSRLGIYTRSYHFKSLSSPEATIPTHVFSLSEKKLMDVHESHGPTLFSHNRNFLMRAFPSGTRVSSSNLDPAIFWRKGVQMVALNWQRFDAGVMLNEGQFAGTGGWVLKPDGYRGTPSQEKSITKETQVDTMTYKLLDLTVEILAAQDIPLLKEDSKGARHPYVKCELHAETPEERSGAPIEGGGRSREGEQKLRTSAKNSQGNDFDFGGERMHFTRVPVIEELAFLRFKIQDDVVGRDDLLAWACLRLDRLCEGHRFVHLLDSKGVQGHGVLLVKVEKGFS